MVGVLSAVMMVKSTKVCRMHPALTPSCGQDFSLQLLLLRLQLEMWIQSLQDSRSEDESLILMLPADRAVRTSHYGTHDTAMNGLPEPIVLA